jgi:Flp pilus assembly pilin Flp
MMELLKSFWREDEGQDLIEYALLLAFVALAAAAIFIGAGQMLSGIWSTTNTVLSNANSVAGQS